jgi:putative tricarboxylic transport membrane protein
LGQRIPYGPNLFIQSAELVYGIFIVMVYIYVLTLLLGFYGSRLFAAVTGIQEAILVPVILIICFVGASALNSSLFDVGLSVAFGVLGYILLKLDFPLAPIVMGLILGPIAEEGLRQSLIVSGGSWLIFLKHPISAAFLAITVFVVFRKAYALVFTKSEN